VEGDGAAEGIIFTAMIVKPCDSVHSANRVFKPLASPVNMRPSKARR
jgi:hypothetical protein